MPAYYERFVCKCGECRSVCCGGWGITLSRNEYYRLLGLTCPAELRRRLDCAVQVKASPTPESYASMAPGFDGRCRLIDDEGYCSLQRACGEDVLPSVCRLYPRSIKRGTMAELCCSGSCENTVELLMHEPCPLRMVTKEKPYAGTLPESIAADTQRAAIREQCIAVMQGSGKTIPERIDAIGALLCGSSARMPAERRTFLQTAYRMVTVFDDVSPNIADYGGEALRLLALPEDGAAEAVTDETVALYDAAQHRLYEVLPGCDGYYENLLVNHMFYEQFPYVGAGTSPRDAYVGLCAGYILLRFLTVCRMGRPDAGANDFADAAAAAFRYIEHSDFYRNACVVMRMFI
ncbi:MAG: flagellin lysine-N-methylase [Clostridiaceae bacterium]|nr:flagellin lysine-N-methylase [Clostridiaceae bacterium]